jgi:hypothetical protein
VNNVNNRAGHGSDEGKDMKKKDIVPNDKCYAKKKLF